MNLDEIERRITTNDMTAAQVFTQMMQHVDAAGPVGAPVMPLLQPMETAQKNGEWVLVAWRTNGEDDVNQFDIRLARWWRPTDLSQWERGARPHWEYIDDSGCREIFNPNGWLPQPMLL